ncbi:cytochrome P450 [Streptomyces sp. NPDC059009]|uniref:cytochrome P450 n=1 Tax=Streptomyces sp. NPDC059009 TaxID=3346694 RepID=UPI00369B445C
MPEQTPQAPPDTGSYPFPPGPHGGCPEAYTQRRRACPVSPVTLPSGDEALLATRYDDIRAVHSGAAFSRNLRYPGAPRMVADDTGIGDDPYAIINMDPPEHARLRRIVQGAFTPRRAESWRAEIRDVADRLLTGMIAAGAPADLVPAFAFPLPVEVICRLLGVPARDSARFRGWSDTLLSLTPADGAARGRAAADFGAYVDGLVADHRRTPGTDLIDDLIDARDEGDRLSEEELGRLVRGLIVAGHETTANIIGRGVLALLRHPDQLAELRADPSLLPGATEEILRTEIPGHGALLRVATQGVALPSGATVGRGEAVLAPMVAANHDPDRFPRPDAFDIRRADNRHLAFGFGPHFCLGAHLARVELQVALEAVVQRLPGLALAVPAAELNWSSGSRVCGLERLPVTW